MNIWLVKLEESLPIDENYRPYRMGMLAEALLQREHHVIRWASDRMHLTNTNRFGKDTTIYYADLSVYRSFSVFTFQPDPRYPSCGKAISGEVNYGTL